MGNKAMKTKLMNMLRERERETRKKGEICKVNKDSCTLKINCSGEITVGKANKGINVEKIIIS